MRVLLTSAIILIFIMYVGCSRDFTQTTPSTSSINLEKTIPVGVSDKFPDGSPAGGMGLLGLFNLKIDPVNIDASLTPIRLGLLTDVLESVDITNFLMLAPCVDCAKLKSIAMDAEGHVVLSIGIKHPFPAGDPLKPITGRNRADLHVFNVEGIVLSDSDGLSFPSIGQNISGLKIVNADGYTGYLDGSLDKIFPTSATIHPYILHFDNYAIGNFDPSNPCGFASVTVPPPSGNLVMAMGCDYDFKDYAFDLQNLQSYQFIYAIGCTYAVSAATKSMRFMPEYRIPQHNKKAASEVAVEIVSNDLRGGNISSTARIQIKVVDINHGVAVGAALNEMLADSSVKEVRVEVLGVASAPIIISGQNSISGSGHSPSDPLIYEAVITNSLGALEGAYNGLVKVLDNYSKGQNESPLLQGMDGIKRVGPTENPLTGLFEIDEFATYQVFSIDVAIGKEIVLTAPNGGEQWDAFTHHDITWISSGGVGNVKIEYSKDNFVNDIHVISPDTENDGVYDWFVPNDPSNNVRVRITELADPTVFDISDSPFEIVQSVVPIWPYMGCDAKGRCLSPFNGTTTPNIKWTYSSESVWSSPSIGPDGTIYVGIYKPNGSINSPGLVAINPFNGAQKWMHFPAVGNYAAREPAVSPDGQYVYYGGDGGAGGNYRGRIYKINASNGSQVWYYQVSCPGIGSHELIDGGPKIGPDGTIYFQTLRPMGVARMWAINPDGTYKWHYGPINSYPYSDMLYHSPCIGNDGCIYVTDPAGQLWKFDSNGASLWPAVYVNYYTKYPGSLDSDNNFYVVCDMGRDVNKFAPDGTLLWSTPEWDFYLHCAPAHDADGYIYATGGWDPTPPEGYRLRKMSPIDGSTIWEKRLEASSAGMMAISADGYIYVGCGSSSSYGPNLQCWDINGNRIFILPLPYRVGSPAIGADGTVYVEAGNVLYAIGD